MKFKTWIPKTEDRNQPAIMRLYFSDQSWVGFKRSTRRPEGAYERHRFTKGETHFSPATLTFGGMDETKANEILETLKAERFAFLQKIGTTSTIETVSVDDAIEFAESK